MHLLSTLAVSLLVGGIRRGRGFVVLPKPLQAGDWNVPVNLDERGRPEGSWGGNEWRAAPEMSPRRRTMMAAAPRRGSNVDSYQTVSVNCSSCGTRLFRYKKKNGTKSNLVKCYVERICEDSAGLLRDNPPGRDESDSNDGGRWSCPKCQTKFARSSMIHGRPALKLVGGKVRMTKK